MKRSHSLYDTIKRLLDMFFSAVLLVLLSPVLLLVAALVRSKLGSPVLFTQQRPGEDGKLFTIYKFRSMAHRAAEDDVAAVATDAERLGRFGRFLRSSSLDELPELWNVFKGEMSFVGPRPLLREYLPRYNEQQARRHEVKPGITGWAQVNGRNATSWEDRLSMDVWYVDNRSFLLDARILLMTLGTIVGRKGVSAPGSATMPPFDPDAENRDGDRS